MDEKTVAKNIKDGIYTHKPNETKKSTGRFWSTFDRIFDAQTGAPIVGYVLCRMCNKISKYDPTKGISNLNTHSEACKTQKQTLTAFIPRENTIKNNHKKELCMQTVAASAKDLRTFNLTEGSGVFGLLHTVWNLGAKVGAVSEEELRRALPCKQTVGRNVNRLAGVSRNIMKAEIKNQIDSGFGLSFTADIWQDKFKRMSYFCITVHFFDEKQMKLDDLILAHSAMEPARRKDNIYLKQIIQEKLTEYDLLPHIDKIVFVSDRGGNIRVALKDYTRLNCFPHFCHNITKYACTVESVNQLITQCAALVKYFKFNGLNNILDGSLKSAISTRFNYVYMMLISIDKQWDQIEEILRQRHEIRRIANINRECIKELTEFLCAFNIASKVTESTYKETLAYVWVGITQICSVCRIQADDPIHVKAIKARALEYIESKFVLHQYHRIATFLHPNYKSLDFCSTDQRQRTVRDTKSLLIQLFPPTTSVSNRLSSSSSSSRSSNSSTDSNSSFLSNYFNRGENDYDEIDTYINLQFVPNEKTNIFDWWIQRKAMFPNLFKLALKMHSIPASSMQSERTFSRGGMTITDRRTNLDPQTVEDLLMLNKNFDFEVRLLYSPHCVC